MITERKFHKMLPIQLGAINITGILKSFRNAMRGVRDVEFFLFRLSKIYA